MAAYFKLVKRFVFLLSNYKIPSRYNYPMVLGYIMLSDCLFRMSESLQLMGGDRSEKDLTLILNYKFMFGDL